jgi:spermidine/putrescine transport system permease protein
VAGGPVPSVDEVVKTNTPLIERRRKARFTKRASPYGLAFPAVFWLGFFFLIPIAWMAVVSLNSGTLETGFRFSWNWSNYTDGLSTFHVQYLRSLAYAGVATFAGLLIAYPVAYWIAFYGGKRKSTYLFLLLLPFFVSFIIRTIQWQFILADNGILLGPLKRLGLLSEGFHILSTKWAVIAGLTYNFLPFIALPLYVALERIDPSLLEAGKDLYANKVTTFFKVVWPLSLPGVFAAFLLSFVPMVGDYVNAELLGGTGNRMIGNIIVTQFQNTYYPQMSALSFVLMAGLLILAVLYARLLGTEDVMEAAGRA